MSFSHRRLLAAAALLLSAAACSNNNSTTPNAPTCTITVGAITTSSFTAAGGTGSVPVTVSATTGCSWTATSSATFVTISAGASGTAAGTVTFTVAANTGAARTATLTVAGSGFTITQSAAVVTPPPAGSLSAPTASSPIGGQMITATRPALVVNNAAAAGNLGAVTYRFEISDLNSFPNDPIRTFTADGIVQGAGTTSWNLNRDLGPDVLWYWHARATDGVTTSEYSATETFRTQSSCTYTISPTSLSINSTSATTTITVTTASNCAWTATASPFIQIISAASGVGSGSVLIGVADNNGPARTGTVTIGGQTFTLTQAGASVSASFQLTDPSTSGAAPTLECRIRSATSATPTTCTLQSTSFPIGTAGIVNYAWTVVYSYDTVKTRSQSGSSPTFSFSDTCGLTGSSDSGATQPLQVILTITDSNGNTATVSSGAGSQPALSIRFYTCGL